MYEIVKSIPWFGWIPIVAIICGSVMFIVSAVHRHAERMEMIKQGMDPSKNDDKS